MRIICKINNLFGHWPIEIMLFIIEKYIKTFNPNPIIYLHPQITIILNRFLPFSHQLWPYCYTFSKYIQLLSFHQKLYWIYFNLNYSLPSAFFFVLAIQMEVESMDLHRFYVIKRLLIYILYQIGNNFIKKRTGSL